jgi:hypothetical protein
MLLAQAKTISQREARNDSLILASYNSEWRKVMLLIDLLKTDVALSLARQLEELFKLQRAGTS